MANTLKFFIRGDEKDGARALDNINNKVVNVTSSFAKWGVAAGVAVAALSIKEATEFQTKIAEVSTLLEDTSGLDAIEQSVKDLAIQYGQFPDDQVESIYAIISAGAETAAEAVQTLEAANKLAIGGVTDVAIAADGLTSVLNAYGEEAGTVTDVSDAMFVAMKAGKTTIEQLSTGIGTVAPIAAEAGVGIDELLAATAALTKSGIQTRIAMTGLRQVVVSVLKPTAEAEKEAKKLGLEFNSTALESKGLQGFLTDLIEKTKGNKDSMTQLFGSVEALGPIFALTGSQAGSFTEIMEDMENKSGATEEAFGKMDETAGQAFNRLKATANVAAITLGNELLPAAADLTNFLVGPTTSGINKIEDAFFFLKATAFSVLGGISESLLSVLRPMVEVSEAVDRFFGRDVKSTMLDDLELFAASMEEGAVETFKARDAAELHNIELRKKSDLLRAVELDLKKKEKAEKDATEAAKKAADAEAASLELSKETIKANDAILKSQQDKFAQIQLMTENAVFNEEEKELARHERQLVQLEKEKELLLEKNLLTEELKSQFNDAEIQAEFVHQENLNNIQKDGAAKSQKFLELSAAQRVNTIISSSAMILSSVSRSNKTLFDIHKALSLANAAVSLPSAVVQSFENAGGYPWGLIPAGLMAAAGAVQIATISGSTFQAHQGIDDFPRSGSFVGNVEKGEMILNKGNAEGIRKLAESADSGGGQSGSLSLTVNINSPMFNPHWDDVIENNIIPAINRNFKRDVLLEGVNYNV